MSKSVKKFCQVFLSSENLLIFKEKYKTVREKKLSFEFILWSKLLYFPESILTKNLDIHLPQLYHSRNYVSFISKSDMYTPFLINEKKAV